MGICFKCSGKKTLHCDKCNGSGKIRNISYIGIISELTNLANDFERCYKCKGKGRRTCDKCHGTGRYSDD